MPGNKKALYCGDTALRGAAAYLAGVMTHNQIPFDYLASHEPFPDALLSTDFSTVILSDYPARHFSADQLGALADRVDHGMGLIMIGGWASFSAMGTGYARTVLSDMLPVVMTDRDDRVNSWQPCIIEKVAAHVMVDNLPFEDFPPSVGGYNRLQAKPDAETLLTLRPLCISRKHEAFEFSVTDQRDPLLVLGRYGRGRVCAFAGDAAPHWVGGLIDWGDSRIIAHAQGANRIEVGNWYATFFANIIRWAMTG